MKQITIFMIFIFSKLIMSFLYVYSYIIDSNVLIYISYFYILIDSIVNVYYLDCVNKKENS